MKTKRTWIQKYSSSPYIVWSVLFVVAPLLFVLYYAFTGRDGSFTFGNFAKMFDGDTAKVFLISLAFALVSTTICLFIAYPLAYLITKAKKKTSNSISFIKRVRYGES